MSTSLSCKHSATKSLNVFFATVCPVSTPLRRHVMVITKNTKLPQDCSLQSLWYLPRQEGGQLWPHHNKTLPADLFTWITPYPSFSWQRGISCPWVWFNDTPAEFRLSSTRLKCHMTNLNTDSNSRSRIVSLHVCVSEWVSAHLCLCVRVRVNKWVRECVSGRVRIKKK